MTKSFRLVLTAALLASAGMISTESASAAKFCRGGHILPPKCSRLVNSSDPECVCSESVGNTTGGANSGGGTNGGGGDPNDDSTEIDPRSE